MSNGMEKLMQKIDRREELVRLIRRGLLAPASPAAADALEKDLRAVLLRRMEEPHGG